MTLTTTELIERTGASHRQIYHWCDNAVISPVRGHVGLVNRYVFDENIVDRVIVLVRVSRALNYRLDVKTLRLIYDNFEDGFLFLDDGIVLSWR